MEWLDKNYFTWWWDVNNVKKALFEYGGCRLKAAEYHVIFCVLQMALYILCSRGLVDLGDVHIFWISAVTAGHQIAIVGPWQVRYMGSSCMGVTPGFVPWVVVSAKGNVRRIVELPCKPQPLLVREVQPGVELFVQLTGNWRAPSFALWSRWWRWFWRWHGCLVSVTRLHIVGVCVLRFLSQDGLADNFS